MLEKFISNISSILGIIGFFITILSAGDIHNNTVSFFGGALLTGICISIFICLKRIPKYTEIEGLRIEAADEIPIFVSRKNSLNPFYVIHTCEIVGCDAILEYEYLGICSSKRGCGQFATSSHSYDISQKQSMDWYAYDLNEDSNRENPIRPTIATPQGATHRVIFNFKKRVEYNCLFHFFTHQLCKNSIKTEGKDYYASVVLYCDKPLSEYYVHLKFHKRPTCINVYSIKYRKGKFLRTLTDYKKKDGVFTYTDHITGATLWSVLCYIFEW